MDMQDIPKQILRKCLPYCAGIWAMNNGTIESMAEEETSRILSGFVNEVLEELTYDPDTDSLPTEENLKAAATAMWQPFWESRAEKGEPHKTWEKELGENFNAEALDSLLETPEFFEEHYTGNTKDELTILLEKAVSQISAIDPKATKKTEPKAEEPKATKKTEPKAEEPKATKKTEPKAEEPKAEKIAPAELVNQMMEGLDMPAPEIEDLEEEIEDLRKDVDDDLASLDTVSGMLGALREGSPVMHTGPRGVGSTYNPTAHLTHDRTRLINWTFYTKFMILAQQKNTLSEISQQLRAEGFIRTAADIVDFQLCWAAHKGTPINDIYEFSLMVDEILN